MPLPVSTARRKRWQCGRRGARGAAGHCERCGGFLDSEGVCHNPRCGTFAMAMRGEPEAQDVTVRNLWRSEFMPGMNIALQNGESLQSGQRFTDAEYRVEKGKAKPVVVVGRTLTMAVDGIRDFQNPEDTESENWVV